ncbi:MAG: DUF2589 domain-containing protein [Bacteroidales bacterium]|nr:DUF2589 domain-containing protein [Bacteroidales bacterium]
MAKKQEQNELQEPITQISLSQAILAPLLSIFKAQVHAARSFLSFLLQIGTPHIPTNAAGEPLTDETQKDTLYMQTFRIKQTNAEGKEETVEIKIPSLSLVPIAPLGVESAEFEFDFRVENYHHHRQMQKSEEDALKKEEKFGIHYRPWYLIDNPINFDGNVAPSAKIEESSSSGQTIKIKIKVSRQPTSAGLDKLLTSFNQYISIASPQEKA